MNINGQETGRKVILDENIFGIEPNEHVIYLDVKRYMANKRQGTHKTKERAEVAFSTRKLFKQKGTGGARRGSIKSPLLKGGGTVFGPRPRSYEQKINKKTKVLARISALSLKAKDNAIVIIEDLQMDAPKTKTIANMMNTLRVNDKRNLFLIDGIDNNRNVLLSCRNIAKTDVMQAADISTYNVMAAGNLVITESALKRLSEVLVVK